MHVLREYHSQCVPHGKKMGVIAEVQSEEFQQLLLIEILWALENEFALCELMNILFNQFSFRTEFCKMCEVLEIYLSPCHERKIINLAWLNYLLVAG